MTEITRLVTGYTVRRGALICTASGLEEVVHVFIINQTKWQHTMVWCTEGGRCDR